jgi:non-heme chloroperoxidase
MRLRSVVSILLFGSIVGTLSAQSSAAWHDPSPHKIQFVTVDTNVKLEVLDWGSPGRPIILLAGEGGTAHVFDDFAPKLASEYHVYAITRRGYGASSHPTTGYTADRLGNDVLAVLDALKLDRPVLVGHSIAGEELSSIGSRYPERVAGLIYLDAAYSYAFFDTTHADLEHKDQVEPKVQSPPPPTATDLASFEAYRAYQKRVLGYPRPEANLRAQFEVTADGHLGQLLVDPGLHQALMSGQQKYTNVQVPVLALFASPADLGPYAKHDPAREAFEAYDSALTKRQAGAVRAAAPSAHIIFLVHANHAIFMSNEPDVLREMRAFITGLN